MLDTVATFHFEMSLLNVGLVSNSESMDVTAAVFQSAMLPYVLPALVGSVSQSVTAAAMLLFVMHVTQSELTVQVVPVPNAGHAVRKVAPQAVCMAFSLQSERALALVHVVAQPAVVTLSTFQAAMFWLNAEAEAKVAYMLATEATFQLAMGWLNATADEKAEVKSEHLATFQLAMFWLNAEAK
jgi:hypothetical protein